MNTHLITQTPFERAVTQARLGQLQIPKVIMGSKNMDYFAYQLAVHKYNLGIMAMGMKCRGIKFTDIKKYYGLNGRSAKDCMPDMIAVMEFYKSGLIK
jgi:hypothetical protein